MEFVYQKQGITLFDWITLKEKAEDRAILPKCLRCGATGTFASQTLQAHVECQDCRVTTQFYFVSDANNTYSVQPRLKKGEMTIPLEKKATQIAEPYRCLSCDAMLRVNGVCQTCDALTYYRKAAHHLPPDITPRAEAYKSVVKNRIYFDVYKEKTPKQTTKRQRTKTGKKNNRDADVIKVMKLHDQGLSHRKIAAACRFSVGKVQYILKQAR